MKTHLIATREQALAFRLSGHHLDQRQPLQALLSVVGACGIQNSPPASAALALHARLEDFTPAALTTALEAERSLLLMWSLRQAPFIFPTRDAAVFTRGLLPPDEPALRHFIRGAGALLDRLGWSTGELVARVRPGLQELLAGPSLPFRRLSTDLTAWLAARLPPDQRPIWESPSGFAPGQSLGEALVHFALRPLSLAGELCFAPRIGAEAAFARVDRWLGAPLPEVDPFQAGVELARRYLHAYGPSTARHFVEWTGVAPAQADWLWQALQAELVEVRLEARRTWLLAADLERFQAGDTPDGMAGGVRFLPPDDPYLAQRDRETLLPEKSQHSLVWRTVGRPGVLLVDGRLVAIWRPQKNGRRLKMQVERFEPLAPGTCRQAEAEAAALASLRECTSVQVAFTDRA